MCLYLDPDDIFTAHVTMVQNPDNINDELISQEINIMCATKNSLQTSMCRIIFRWFETFKLQIWGSSPKNSVDIYIMCMDVQSCDKLKELNESGELKSKLEELINLVIAPTQTVNISVTADENNLKKLRAHFSNKGNIVYK